MADHLAQLLEAEARKRPGKTVLLSDGGDVDWRRLEGRAGAVAASLAGQGVGRGSRVALGLEDPAELVVALFGATQGGAPPCCRSTRGSPPASANASSTISRRTG